MLMETPLIVYGNEMYMNRLYLFSFFSLPVYLINMHVEREIGWEQNGTDLFVYRKEEESN